MMVISLIRAWRIMEVEMWPEASGEAQHIIQVNFEMLSWLAVMVSNISFRAMSTPKIQVWQERAPVEFITTPYYDNENPKLTTSYEHPTIILHHTWSMNILDLGSCSYKVAVLLFTITIRSTDTPQALWIVETYINVKIE